MPFEISALLNTARSRKGEFARLVRDVPHESLGVLYSEALFVGAALDDWRGERIVESGRARGQSTLLLALCFPSVEIHSVELDPHSPHAPVAATRLAHLPKVKLLFGDSRRVLPEITRAGDVVVIDGPKDYRGLKLAIALLAHQRPHAVFMHDCYQGSEERTFLQRAIPNALFSDDPQFEELARELDARCFEKQGGAGWRPHLYKGRQQASYGPTYACLPYDARIPYAWILTKLRVEAMWHSARRSVNKRVGVALDDC
jgi:hypothetical protein